MIREEEARFLCLDRWGRRSTEHPGWTTRWGHWGIANHTSSPTALPKLAPAPKRIKVCRERSQGLLIQKIEPRYPLLAQCRDRRPGSAEEQLLPRMEI